MKALINLGHEGNVDFHGNPVFHCMSILLPVVVMVLLAATALHHLCSRSSFPDSCPSFRAFVYKKRLIQS